MPRDSAGGFSVTARLPLLRPAWLLLMAGLAGCPRHSGAPSGMKPVPGGHFLMGEAGLSEPVHGVTVASFFMDSVPVTQREYLARMGADPSHFTGDPDRPVETVTWFDAALYCNARGKAEGRDTVYAYASAEGKPGNGCVNLGGLEIRRGTTGYRLPTEAEYEYAERAGTAGEFYWGDTLDGNYAWYYANANQSTQPVGRLRPNAFGLHDMAGNLWEWCGDWYAPYPAGEAVNPAGPDTGSFRVLRGGSWYTYYPLILGSAFRFYLEPAPRFKPPREYYGFRCVLPAR
jgi:sulfatase modifying factor 1